MITELDKLTPDSTESAFINCDCMEAMKRFPDNYFDLAIVDPPYGIGVGHKLNRGGRAITYGESKKALAKQKEYHMFDDSTTPDEEYFKELFRVSKAQIIWGGNFFLDYLGNASCLIVWDKGRRNMDQADCEIAWTSLKGQSRVFNYMWNGMLQENMKNKERRIHITQKPVVLYKWCIDKFAKEGDVILDTHVGSASSLIACYKMNHRFIGFEKDGYYYKEALDRLNDEMAQMTIFDMIGESKR